MNDQPVRLLDVTRLLSRAGRGLTGVDRVERAYLRRLLAEPGTLYLLARTSRGYLLMDREGGRAVFDDDGEWPSGAMMSKRAAEARMRSVAIARCLPFFLMRMLDANLPQGVNYLNVGHSNLTDRVLWAVSQLPSSRVAVMVHDMIPLDFPQFQRAGTVEKFRKKMQLVSQYADLVTCNSMETRLAVARYFEEWGRQPKTLVAHLASDAAPEKLRSETRDRPYFVALGTIEPRKNHGFLLDVWDALRKELAPQDLPDLCIVGRRGWNNEEVFRQLDMLGPQSGVIEMGSLGDSDVQALLSGASGLLAPSLAEGFGLPLLEAAMLGTPILANDLPVYHEFLQDIPVYASVNDRYLWARTIIRMAVVRHASDPNEMDPRLPSWDEHFNRVLKVT